MAHKLYKVSVPGSLMLLGEHAVLVGKQAVTCAVNKRLTMQLAPCGEDQITISDTRLGTLVQSLDNLQITDPFKFVTAAISLFKDQIPSGFKLDIKSEFSSVLGLGSSAAVTVATIATLGQWLYAEPLSNEQIFALGKQVMLQVQGVGSGADLAASIFGGVVGFRLGAQSTKSVVANHYCLPQTPQVHPCRLPTLAGKMLRIFSIRLDPWRRGRGTTTMVSDYGIDFPSIERLPLIPNLTAVYCGYKTPTAEVIKMVREAQQQHPSLYANIFNAIHDCVQRAIGFIKNSDWQQLGDLFMQHHTLQVALGVSNELLDNLAYKLSAQPEIYGAKISGSGLGDCVIGLGELPRAIFTEQPGIQQFPVVIESDGLKYV